MSWEHPFPSRGQSCVLCVQGRDGHHSLPGSRVGGLGLDTVVRGGEAAWRLPRGRSKSEPRNSWAPQPLPPLPLWPELSWFPRLTLLSPSRPAVTHAA